METEQFQENVAFYLAQKALEEMAVGINPGLGKTDRLKGQGKLADSSGNQRHVLALAKKIMADPSFPMLLDTARKMAEEYPNALNEDK